MLGLEYDIFSHTSDHFDLILDYCTKLIKEGRAYVDSTDGETMKKEREERVESKCWNNCKYLCIWFMFFGRGWGVGIFVGKTEQKCLIFMFILCQAISGFPLTWKTWKSQGENSGQGILFSC